MDTYVFFETTLRMLENAYLASVLILIAVSGVGLAVIATIEKSEEYTHKPKALNLRAFK